MDGEGMQLSNRVQSTIQGWTLNLNWSDKKVKTINKIQCFGFQYTLFFLTCHALITWFLVIEDKIVYGNDLKGKKLPRVSGRFEPYRGLEFNTKGKITVNVTRKSRGNQLCSSLRGFQLSGVNCSHTGRFCARLFLNMWLSTLRLTRFSNRWLWQHLTFYHSMQTVIDRQS